MGSILKQRELQQVEDEIDALISSIDSANPTQSSDAWKLEVTESRLLRLIELLESSYRKTRVLESNLRLVS